MQKGLIQKLCGSVLLVVVVVQRVRHTERARVTTTTVYYYDDDDDYCWYGSKLEKTERERQTPKLYIE